MANDIDWDKLDLGGDDEDDEDDKPVEPTLEERKQLANDGIQLLCEALGVMRESLVRNGFKRKEAVEVAIRYMESHIMVNGGG
jgi:hypothetical protein